MNTRPNPNHFRRVWTLHHTLRSSRRRTAGMHLLQHWALLCLLMLLLLSIPHPPTLLAQAAPLPVPVRPGALGDPLAPPLERWGQSNLTSGTATIGTTWPRGAPPDQLGAFELGLTNLDQRAEVQYFWNLDAFPNRTLGTLSALSFDWLRAPSSTVSDTLAPALRLYYTNGPGELGILTWERRFNTPGPAPTNTWNSASLLGDIFWMQRLDLGQAIERYDVTLAQWIAGTEITDPNGRPAHILGPNTRLLAIGVAIGPGWNGAFSGAVDNIVLQFGPDDLVSANFEPDAPGFGSLPPPTSTLNLGSILVGGGQLSTALQITETRNLTLTVGAPQINGPHAADFSITPDVAFALADGAAPRTLTISCRPNAPGLRIAELRMDTNDPILPEAVYSLACIGTQPGFGSIPATNTQINLGSAIPGNDTPPTLLQINSVGSATLLLTPTLSGAPQISVNTLAPITLAPGESATMQLGCRPESVTTYQATLQIATNDPNRPANTYTLVCGGLVSRIFLPAIEFARGPDLIVEQIAITPTSDLTSATPVVVSVTIRNQGDTATTRDFWVDLYINPSRRPLPHDLWYRLCPAADCVGLAWPVTQVLAPGERLTLSSATGFDLRQSRWTGLLSAGEVQVYAQVDSWNTFGFQGNIPEYDETNNVGALGSLRVR